MTLLLAENAGARGGKGEAGAGGWLAGTVTLDLGTKAAVWPLLEVEEFYGL